LFYVVKFLKHFGTLSSLLHTFKLMVDFVEHKLFIGMLPKTVTDEELSALFSKYGNIKDLQILRGSQQTSKGTMSFM
jgi:RNA recognition motif. (a.k.a. RRM, RBD, or RNP domain)